MSNFNISIFPPQTEFVLKPGITLTRSYEITNNSNESISLNTQVVPFTPQGDDGSVTYQNVAIDPNFSFSLNNSDIALGQPFNLEPNQKIQLVLKIKTSPTANLSDYYATFFVYQNLSPFQSNDSFSQATGKIGSHILLSVSSKEDTSPSGQIQKFSASPKIQDVFLGSVKFSGQVFNNSNYFFKTDGKITVTKGSKTIKEFNLVNNNILNHYFRRLTCQDDLSCSLSGPFWPGKYTATVQLNSSLNTPPVSTSFFVIPLSPIIFILLI
jgi:hypothetical protein